jgi:hypothetical protein
MAITDCGRATQSAVRATTISTTCLGVEAHTIVSSAVGLMLKVCECVSVVLALEKMLASEWQLSQHYRKQDMPLKPAESRRVG